MITILIFGVIYLLVLAAWVVVWAVIAGHKGELPYSKRPPVKGTDEYGRTFYGQTFESQKMSTYEKWAVWGLAWPLFLPAGVVAAPFVGIYFLVAGFIELYDRVHSGALKVAERKKELA